MRFLLDTNICIYVTNERPPHIKEKFEEHARELCISSVTEAELRYGAYKSARVGENLRELDRFVGRLTILPFESDAADHFGDIRAFLVAAGKQIGPYDTMIAAIARAHGLTLVTNNTKEFERVPGLKIEDWV